jgi:hypothetical protein
MVRLLEAMSGEESAIRLGRRGKAVEHADALWLERPEQFAKRRVLSTYATDISQREIGEVDDVSGCSL